MRTGLAQVFAGDFTHVLLSTATCSICPGSTRLISAAETTRADVVIGERTFRASGDARLPLPRKSDRKPRTLLVCRGPYQ